MASMPGYELTEPWLTEEGLPKKGIWDVVYYAGEGKLKLGCKPLPKLRRSLLQLVSVVCTVVVMSIVVLLTSSPFCVHKTFRFFLYHHFHIRKSDFICSLILYCVLNCALRCSWRKPTLCPSRIRKRGKCRCCKERAS